MPWPRVFWATLAAIGASFLVSSAVLDSAIAREPGTRPRHKAIAKEAGTSVYPLRKTVPEQCRQLTIETRPIDCAGLFPL